MRVFARICLRVPFVPIVAGIVHKEARFNNYEAIITRLLAILTLLALGADTAWSAGSGTC